MIIISNQLFIDFLRINNLAKNIRNEQLGIELDKIIQAAGGKQLGRISCGRDNEIGEPCGFPKTSMSYNFPSQHLGQLYNSILNQYR